MGKLHSHLTPLPSSENDVRSVYWMENSANPTWPTVQGAYFFRNRVRSIPMYIGMSNDFYRLTKIASCAPGLSLDTIYSESYLEIT